MKTFLLLGMGLYAAAPVAEGMANYPWTDVGAVAALGAAVLILITRTIPKMNKDNNDAHARRDERQIAADDKRDVVLREVMMHCSRNNKEA